MLWFQPWGTGGVDHHAEEQRHRSLLFGVNVVILWGAVIERNFAGQVDQVPPSAQPSTATCAAASTARRLATPSGSFLTARRGVRARETGEPRAPSIAEAHPMAQPAAEGGSGNHDRTWRAVLRGYYPRSGAARVRQPS